MLHVGREGGNLGEREGGLTFHMMVNWVELFDIMEGAIGSMMIEGLLIKIMAEGLLREAVVMVMFAGLLTRPTALVSMTCMV